MDPSEAAAAIWYLIGVIPAGVVAFRRREDDGVEHVLSRATAWPLFVVIGLFVEDPWRGSKRPEEPVEQLPLGKALVEVFRIVRGKIASAGKSDETGA